MKKVILLAAFVVSTLSMNAQEFNLGLSGALPVADTEELSTAGLLLDANYLWNVSERFDLGVTAGYHHYFSDDPNNVDLDDFGFLPVAVSGRFNATENLAIGADFGFAAGVTDSTDEGFYYAPKVQYGVTQAIDIVLAYRGINQDYGSFDSVSLGIEFEL
ncbi:outer membrane beta-barrel protein [Psychroflexus sediminis]|uniref:Outer membrane protein beta-barrel domain-containing protein n=1 Tax=Psychroflexus sediminis TaxID=470826 RepID=A0A1G7VNQ8_9FLAO|nr:outer membrane beta-barrel protein [Psychroflexus sediminis]SDG61188.1 Outer membrane protein beta-barrel domain-containing protein [Psychroflexus sediminis]